MKYWFWIGFFFILLLTLSTTILTMWKQNKTAVFTVTHLTPTSSCAIDEPRLKWTGEPSTSVPSPYLQAVVASAVDNTTASPPLTEWERDPRLYYLFLAETAVKHGNYADSLTHLTTANAGRRLDAAGHFAATEACSIINWTIASEIGYREPPDGHVQHLTSHQLYEDVAESFTRLLHYDTERAAWRLALAKAYVEMAETAVGTTDLVEETLMPILLNGTSEEIEEANKILQTIQ